MTERVLGPTGSPRRRWTLFLPFVAALALGLFYIAGAQAVHDNPPGLFELDRNAAASTAPGDDWSTLYASGANNGCVTPCAVFTGILPDIGADGGTQFQGGGSKDDLDISEWLYKDGEPLDKDDITNAYAAGYVIPTGKGSGSNAEGDFIVYFGLDRFSNDGSAQVGFWFFKNDIALTDTKSGGGFKFGGVHAVGDVLVQSNFEQGGVVDSVSVFKWVGSGGSNGSLDLLFTASDCVGPPLLGSDDPACATVNRDDTSSPWPFTPKSGSAGTFPQGSFFEGGINLSRLVEGIGCLSSFLAETRSSTPFDSRLKDLRRGSFNTCRATIATSSSPSTNNVVPGASVTDSVTITGSSLTGGTAPVPQGTVKFFLCQPTQVTTGGCEGTAGTQIGATKTLSGGSATSDATTNTTAVGKYCWRVEYTPATGSPYSAASHTNGTIGTNGECFQTVAQPTTTTTRQFVYPQDKARIAASSGGNLAGNVTFKLYDSSANCTANGATGLLLTDGPHTISGASPQFATTNNTTARVTSDTTVYWRVTYLSTNPAQLGSSSVCLESTAVMFAGNDTAANIPIP